MVLGNNTELRELFALIKGAFGETNALVDVPKQSSSLKLVLPSKAQMQLNFYSWSLPTASLKTFLHPNKKPSFSPAH